MFNFANKAATHESKTAAVNFSSFWKHLDDTHFAPAVSSIQAKYKKVVTVSEDVLKSLEGLAKKAGAIKVKRKVKKKSKKSSDVLLGYPVRSIWSEANLEEETKQKAPSNELEYEMEKMSKCVGLYESINESLVRVLSERIALEAAHSSSKFTKEAQTFFIKQEIKKLETKQVAESVVSIFKCSGNADEFEVLLDPAACEVSVHTTRLTQEQVKLLSKYREGMFNASPYDTSKLSTKQFICKDDEVDEMPIEQVGNLLDERVMGREIVFTMFGMCHHCKEIQPLRRLLKCKRVTSNIAKPTPTKRRKGRRSLANYNQEVNRMDLSKPCERRYCFGCVYLNYDQELNAALGDAAWTCPYCQVLCSAA